MDISGLGKNPSKQGAPTGERRRMDVRTWKKSEQGVLTDWHAPCVAEGVAEMGRREKREKRRRERRRERKGNGNPDGNGGVDKRARGKRACVGDGQRVNRTTKTHKLKNVT